jgi:hypothetical protein
MSITDYFYSVTLLSISLAEVTEWQLTILRNDSISITPRGRKTSILTKKPYCIDPLWWNNGQVQKQPRLFLTIGNWRPTYQILWELHKCIVARREGLGSFLDMAYARLVINHRHTQSASIRTNLFQFKTDTLSLCSLLEGGDDRNKSCSCLNEDQATVVETNAWKHNNKKEIWREYCKSIIHNQPINQ